MPDETLPLPPVSCPNGYGLPIKNWLETEGYPSRVPAVRSGDLNVLGDPFTYYLSRRLGLHPRVRVSRALSRGSWFHTVFQTWRGALPDVMVRKVVMETILPERLSELTVACKESGLDGDDRAQLRRDEEKDCLTALTWFEASMDIPCYNTGGGTRLSMREYFSLPTWRWIAVEPRLLKPRLKGTRLRHWLIAQPDVILYDIPSGKLWLVDIKTTALTPLRRLASCLYEFQSSHYCSVADSCLLEGAMPLSWSLPLGTQLGGIIHAAFEKPGIQFGLNDREYVLDTTPLKSGPRKGQPRNEKQYIGEPRLDIYLRRCKSWYRSEDEYAHLAPSREKDPPVNLSIVDYNFLLDGFHGERYLSHLDHVSSHATRDAHPANFPCTSELALPGQRPSPYATLKVSRPEAWPKLFVENGLVASHRDPDLPPPGTSCRVILEPQ